MIDLLGMILPGSLMVLIFGTEFGVWEMLPENAGLSAEELTAFILILLVGYVAGMLLHELGDLAEKLLWRNRMLNPRVWAACRTGYYNYLYSKENNESGSGFKATGAVFTVVVLLAATVWVYQCSSINSSLLLCWEFFLILLFSTVTAVLSCFYRFKGDDGTNRKRLKILKKICSDNTPFSYRAQKISGADEKYTDMVLRKRDLFDGFRAVARNLLVMVTLLDLYAALTKGNLHQLREDILKEPSLWIPAIIILVLLAIRYYHYAYLRSKYCYEDLMERIETRETVSVDAKQETAPSVTT